MIDYTLKDSATPVQSSYRLVTNILDPEVVSALELTALYHERGEIESVFDEFRTHRRSTSAVLRSKTPALVEQELRVLLLGHYAVRRLMKRDAWQQGLPTSISSVLLEPPHAEPHVRWYERAEGVNPYPARFYFCAAGDARLGCSMLNPKPLK